MKILKLAAISLGACLLAAPAEPGELQRVGIVYPNGGFNWPLFIAKDGDYFRKYGLDVTLTFGGHPDGVAMVVSENVQADSYALAPLMLAASKDSSLVLVSSPINRGVFALMAKTEIRSVRDLRGKRLAIGQLGDANYAYSVAVLRLAGLSPRDVEWVPLGPNTNGRVAALIGGRVDATLLTAPAYFKLETAGFRTLANFAEEQNLFASAAILMKRRVVNNDPELPVRIIQAETEAIKRFYDDKSFAVRAFMHYDRNTPLADVERLYDLYAKPEAFERVPYLQSKAVAAAIEQEPDPHVAEQLRSFDFHRVVDNSFVERLVSTGFFEKVFGDGIRAEQERKSKLAFNLPR